MAATWNSPAEGSVLSGLAAFDLSFSASDTNHPLAQVDLFVDGCACRDHHELAAQPRQISLSVNIDGVTANYTVTNSDTLASAALGLASSLTNLENVTGVEAFAVGDRLLFQLQIVATLGSRIQVQAGKAAIGSAPALTSFATASQPTFLAKHRLRLPSRAGWQ